MLLPAGALGSCVALAQTHGIVRGGTMGTAPASAQQAWADNLCSARICAYYQSWHRVVPCVSDGTLAGAMLTAWFYQEPSGRFAGKTCYHLWSVGARTACGSCVDVCVCG